MRRFGVIAAALILAAGTLTWSSEADARRRGFGIGAGIVAAAVIGGIIAASVHRRHRYGYAYYPRRAYFAPAYYRPVYRYRPVYAYRPVRIYRGGFYGPRRVHRAFRRW